MRQYRGKRKDNGEWVKGWYCEIDNKSYILPTDRSSFWGGDNYNFSVPDLGEFNLIRVIPETVGQSTGLHDKNGKEIYEGDITRVWSSFRKREFTGSIFWSEKCGKFDLKNKKGNTRPFGNLITQVDWFFEIIGNIHENPELLKTE